LTWLTDAFWDLTTDRPISMGGMAPIPRASVSDFIQTEGITETQTFRTLIRAMDTAYMKAVRRKTE